MDARVTFTLHSNWLGFRTPTELVPTQSLVVRDNTYCEQSGPVLIAILLLRGTPRLRHYERCGMYGMDAAGDELFPLATLACGGHESPPRM